MSNVYKMFESINIVLLLNATTCAQNELIRATINVWIPIKPIQEFTFICIARYVYLLLEY